MIPCWRILNVYLLIDSACWLGGISARCSASYVGILVDFLTWTICFRPFHNISVRLRSRLWLGHFKTLTFSSTIFFLSVERLVCLGALSSCMTNLFLRFSSWTDVLTFSFRLYQDNSESKMEIHLDCNVVKQDQTIAATADWIIFLCWNAVLPFLET